MAQTTIELTVRFSLHKAGHFKANTVLTYFRLRLGHRGYGRQKCHLSAQVLTAWLVKGNVFETHLLVKQHLQIPKLVFPCSVDIIYVPTGVQSGDCGDWL